MSESQRRNSVALLKLTVNSTAAPPKVNKDGILNFHAGDRLLFDADDGADVLVNLGDEITGLLLALVKFKGLHPENVMVEKSADGRYILTLVKPGGDPGGGDPPG